ncbi:MAG: hypothetical protein WC517_01040 [Patescibacteria group bacterium]
MNRFFVRTFCISAIAACFFVFGDSAAAETVIWHANGEHLAASTLWRAGEVHVIPNGAYFYVDPGVNLTLESGVIVKVGFNSRIIINGGLFANGAKENLIKLVSLRDDSVGGDTNGDGSATVAGLDDWRGISADGGQYNSVVKVNLAYVEIKHGGRGWPRGMIIYATKVNELKINNCNLVDNLGVVAIDAASKNVSINHSNLYNLSFCDYASTTAVCHWDNGVTDYSSQPIDLTDNYWGSALGPTYTTGTSPTVFTGTVLANLSRAPMSYIPFATEPFDFGGSPKRHPVILIPGILGSWPDWQGVWQIDPILHTYDDLINALRLAGYEDGKMLFTLPYDWTQSNVVTAGFLKDKINSAKDFCVASEIIDCSKVDLIGHSMGGIVARAYIEGDDYQNDVDQMIFVATPHKGSVDSYLMIEGGDISENKMKNLVYKKLLEVKAELNGYKTRPFYDGLMYYVREMVPSVGELLPVYDYLRDKDSGELRAYPDNYPLNGFLENLNLSVNLAKFNQIKITNILGDTGSLTLSALRVIPSFLYSLDGKWEHGIPENYNISFTDRGLELGLGDGTVPQISNSNFIGINDTIINNASHLGVVSLAQSEIIKELTGQEPETIISSSPIDNLLIFRIFSPADFQIIGPDGGRLGRDFDSTSILNEITDGYYSGFSDASSPELAIITNPLPGNYQIKLLGTASGGSYTFSVSSINNTTSSESLFNGAILADQDQFLSFNYEPSVISASITEIGSNITIQTAIDDLALIYDRQLLTDNNVKKKIIHQYNLLKLKVEIFDKLIKLAQDGVEKLAANEKLKPAVKDKLIALANVEIDKWQVKRKNEIRDGLNDINLSAQKLLTGGVLKQLGYDIIKSNNDYLTNNW